MRALLAILFALTFVACSHAANPSFSSFFPNHFTTNNLIIKANLNPSQFDTNSSSITITITNISGVAGASIWTNILGVIQLLGGQTTNALLFNSGSADAATNTALTVDTVNTWTTHTSKLLDLKHRGTNVAYVTPYGSFESGKGVAYNSPSDDDVLSGVHNTALGESDYARLSLSSIDGSSPTNFSVFRAWLNTGVSPGASLTLGSAATNLVSTLNVALQPDQGVARIDLVNQGGTIFNVADNGGVYVGKNSYSLFGDTPNAISQFRDVSLGDSPSAGIAVYSRQTAGAAIGTYDLAVGTNSVQMDVGWNDGVSPGKGISFLVASSDLQFSMSDLNGIGRVNFQPSATSTTTNSMAHFLDVDNTWTQGYLAGVKNNSTNMFTVAAVSGYNNPGTLFLSNDGTYKVGGSDGTNTSVMQLGPFTPLYLPVANGTNTLTDSPVHLPSTGSTNIIVDGSIQWASGATNVLRRDANALWFENQTATLGARVNAGNYISFVMFGGTAPHISASSTVYFDNNIVTKAITPDADDSYDIGQNGIPGAYQDLYMKGIAYIQGSNDGTGNNTQLQIEHMGNAGDIEIRSMAQGTQTFRPMQFKVGTTNVFKLDTTSVAGETRMWLYDEDNGTMERVTVGAADSGGVGFKLLRIPN